MSCCSAAADAFCFQLWLVFTWEPSWATTCAASVALEEINGTQRCCNRQGWCWAPGREGGFLGYFPTGKSRLCHRIHPNFTINGWCKHDKPSKDGWIVISFLLYLTFTNSTLGNLYRCFFYIFIGGFLEHIRAIQGPQSVESCYLALADGDCIPRRWHLEGRWGIPIEKIAHGKHQVGGSPGVPF